MMVYLSVLKRWLIAVLLGLGVAASWPHDVAAQSAVITPREFNQIPGFFPVDEIELHLMMAGDLNQRLRDNRRILDELENQNSPQAQRIQGEIERLETRLKNGPDQAILIREMVSQVSQMMDLPLGRELKFEVLDQQKMKQFIDAKLEEDLPPDYLIRYELLLKSVGALPWRSDLRRLLVRLLSEQAAGLFDPITKKIYASANFSLDRPISRIILAHEICHAIQDYHFDLRKMMKASQHDDDRSVATLALIEGEATQLMMEYAVQHLRIRSPLDFLEILTQDQSAFRSTPFYLRQSLVYPYIKGQELILAIDLHPSKTRDEAFENPPESSEQLEAPQKYFGPEFDRPSLIRPLTLESDRLTTVAQNTMGHFGIRTTMEVWRTPGAAIIANGWDADLVQVWSILPDKEDSISTESLITSQPHSHSVTWTSLWDTENDAMEFVEGVEQLFVRGPYRHLFPEGVAQAGVNTLVDGEGRPAHRRVSGASSTLSIFRKNKRVIVVLAQGRTRELFENLTEESLLLHLESQDLTP
jgi:hypothetical protein